VGRPKLDMEDEMKTKRKMDEDEKDRRMVARINRMELAAKKAVRCSACGEAGKILWNGDQPPLASPPPLSLVENPWLLECYPLCVDCIEAGERIELCFEGRGRLHNFWPVAGRAICLDCGEPDDERENKNPVPGQG
jgi:hypothetical protein